MSKNQQIIDSAIKQEYEYGFVTDIDQDTIAPGLSDDVIKFISSKKNEPDWLLDWRLKAYHRWLKMEEPDWSKLNYSKIDFQSISYYSAPKKQKKCPVAAENLSNAGRTYRTNTCGGTPD